MNFLLLLYWFFGPLDGSSSESLTFSRLVNIPVLLDLFLKLSQDFLHSHACSVPLKRTSSSKIHCSVTVYDVGDNYLGDKSDCRSLCRIIIAADDAYLKEPVVKLSKSSSGAHYRSVPSGQILVVGLGQPE